MLNPVTPTIATLLNARVALANAPDSAAERDAARQCKASKRALTAAERNTLAIIGDSLMRMAGAYDERGTQ